MKRYKVIVGTSVDEFNERADKAITEGWYPSKHKLIFKFSHNGNFRYIKEFFKEDKKRDVLEKLIEVIKRLRVKYNPPIFNDKIFRDHLIQEIYNEMDGYEIKIKCDEENNTPSIIYQNKCLVKINYNIDNNCYNYMEFMFGVNDGV